MSSCLRCTRAEVVWSRSVLRMMETVPRNKGNKGKAELALACKQWHTSNRSIAELPCAKLQSSDSITRFMYNVLVV